MLKPVFQIFITILLFSTTKVMSAQQTNQLLIKKTIDFNLDGTGDSKNWSISNWIELEQILVAGDQYQTRAKLMYSETGLYVLFDCEDKKITATIEKDMGNLYLEDVVEIFLWTDDDYPVYFEYELSPLNYELVLMVPNFGGRFYGWIPWHYEDGRKTMHRTLIKKGAEGEIKGWIAECFIPFELLNPLLNVPPQSGSQWKVNLYRLDYDQGEQSRWAWRPVNINFHEFHKFGRAVFE